MNILSAATLLFSLSFLLVVGYFLFYPVDILKFKNPLPVQTKQVKAGDSVNYVFKYEKLKDVPVSVVKTLQCPNTIETLTVKQNGQENIGYSNLKLSDIIPSHIPSAKDCRIFIHLEYKVNFFRTVEYNIYTESFEIINTKL